MAGRSVAVGAGWPAASLAVLLLAGCSPDSPAPVPPPPPPPAPVASPAPPPAAPAARTPYDPASATAFLLVRARLKGPVPPAKPLDFSADEDCGKAGMAPRMEESVVSRDGGLGNVIVWTSSGAERWTYPREKTPVLLDQQGCMFTPRVLTLRIDQPLAIRNSDPFVHNVHATTRADDLFNRSQLKGADDITEKFTKEEVGIRVICDIHKWMRAWIGVFPHPFHGVTGADGDLTFRLPPGEYEVSAWHEWTGFAKPAPRKVTLVADAHATVEFVFEAKK